MDITMVGIDYRDAGLDIRGRFSYTKREQEETIKYLRQLEGISGCVLLSTCNRTELVLSYTEEWDQDEKQLFCGLKDMEPEQYVQYLHIRRGMEAVQDLFALAGGLKSQILGEDQILTQMKDAADFSRQFFGTDKILETLFRMAVTAGKEVKTKIVLPSSNHSAPLAAISGLERNGASFQGQKCLVIGNGAMGRLTAQLLLDRGADVTVTIRQYRSGIVDVPPAAGRIDYSKRYEKMPECRYIFSATASPNITITLEKLPVQQLQQDTIFVDLAVPRDIQEEIGTLPGITLYDIDDFGAELPEDVRQSLSDAEILLREKTQEFQNWYDAKDVVPMLLQISEKASEDVMARVTGQIRKSLPVLQEKNEKTDLTAAEEIVRKSVQKVVNKLMFSVRDSVDVSTFRDCVDAMSDLYPGETSDGSR